MPIAKLLDGKRIDLIQNDVTLTDPDPGLTAMRLASDGGLWAKPHGGAEVAVGGGSAEVFGCIVLKIDHNTADGAIVDQFSGEVAALPANCYTVSVDIVRIEDFATVTNFEVGKAANTDWLLADNEHNLLAADPALRSVVNQLVVLENTPIFITMNQAGNTAGDARVFIIYRKWES